MRVAVLVVVAAAGCRVSGAFVCETDEQCRAPTGLGTCDTTSGFCTFADADCPSGTRYADNAGDSVAGTCTTAEAPVDAAPIDAPPFSTTQCPAVFTKTVASIPNTRLALMTSAGNYGAVAAACMALLPGATHPVSVKSTQAAEDISELLRAGGPANIFVGVIQDPAAPTPISGWLNFDGTAFDATLWRTTAPTDPNDLNGNEDDHREQAAVVTSQGEVIDYPHVSAVPLACACDGVAVPATVMAYLSGNTWSD